MKNTELFSAEATAGLTFCVRLTPGDSLLGTTPAESIQGKTFLCLTGASPAEALEHLREAIMVLTPTDPLF